MADTTVDKTEKAREGAEAAAAKAAEAKGAAEAKERAAVETQRETAEESVEILKKGALNKDGSNKTTSDGLVVGLDGKNPVSNENPDPRAVRGARFL